MGFNYRKERKKFEQQMQEKEQQYRAAGMSKEQIHAMREFEEALFRSERVYGLHIVLEQSKEYPGLVGQEQSFDIYFDSLKANLDFLLDNLAPGLADRIAELDKKILICLTAGYNHREIAQELRVTQQAVSKRINKVRKTLKKWL